MSKTVYIVTGFGRDGTGGDNDLRYVYVFDTKVEAEAFVAKAESIKDGVTFWEITPDMVFVHSDNALDHHKMAVAAWA